MLFDNRFEQMGLWLVLALASYTFLYFEWWHVDRPPFDTVSIFGWLPESIIMNKEVVVKARWVFWPLAVLWALNRGLPWTAWGASLAFLLGGSLYLENRFIADHSFHLLSQILIVFALCPRRVKELSVFCIAIYYFYAGLSKVLDTGWGWVDGIYLQFIAFIWGQPDSPVRSMLIDHPVVAQAAQSLVLGMELAAPLILFFAAFRIVFVLFFVSFHIAGESLFSFGFEENICLLIYFLLPWEKALPLLNRVRKNFFQSFAPGIFPR